jgi:hypothetical protein
MIDPMTTHARRTDRPRWVLASPAAVLAVLTTLAGATTASATTGSAAQNAVGASTSAGQVVVGASASISAGQRLGTDPAQPQIVMATGVAANTADQVAAAVPRAVHGNSASSSATAYLYRLSNAESGAYLKTGFSQNLMTRYTRTFMQDKERSGGDGPRRGTRAGPRCRRAAVRPLEPSPRRTVASPGPIQAESSSSPT